LVYNGFDNGTVYKSATSEYASLASQAEVATLAFSADVATSSSYATTASYCTTTSSYSILAGSVVDVNLYRLWGPFEADVVTTTEHSSTNYIIKPPTTSPTTIIVMTLCDVKSPMTNSDTDLQRVTFYLDDLTETPASYQADQTKPNNYIGITAMSGAIALTGYIRTSTTLAGGLSSVSGSWYRLAVRATGGALLDTDRKAKFFIYTKMDTTVTKTAYPPF
jgi:hypothetical protein